MTKLLQKNCVRCSLSFEGKPQSKYCSKKCQKLYWSESGRNAAVKNRYNYGIEPEEYAQKLHEQNEACAICKRKNTGRKTVKDRLFVDHCHKTGKFRGILCHKCNITLGLMEENPEFLRSAADYLERKN